MPAIIAAGVCIALCGLVSAASPQLPCEFYGTVTLQGSPAPAGTMITAYIKDTPRGTITMSEPGKFGGTGTFDERLIVMSAENDFVDGVPTITFRVNNQTAEQTASYHPGQSTVLNLTIGGDKVIVASVQENQGTNQSAGAEQNVTAPVNLETQNEQIPSGNHTPASLN